MAHVSIGPPDGKRLRESDRGQLLIVAGLVMAVSLVALVVLLNATIYSENVATRGIEPADGEAMEVRASAVDGVGETIDAVNRDVFGESGSAPTDALEADIDDLEERIALNYVRRGGATSLDTNASRMNGGWYLSTEGNETSLANASNATAYTFAGDVDRTRRFVLELEPETLVNETATDGAFRVVLNGTQLSEPREVVIYRDDAASGADEHVVVVEATGGGPNVTCRTRVTDDDTVSLDLTGEQLEGSPCFDLWPAALVTPDDSYGIAFENADAAAGTVEATVRTESGSEAGSEPTADHDDLSAAVYDATIDLRYRTAELRFETTVRVAPGEPHA